MEELSSSVGELKVKGQKDEKELVIQEALASQLYLWKKNLGSIRFRKERREGFFFI